MKKKIGIIIAVVIVVIIGTALYQAAQVSDRTTMETMLYDANKFTKANHDDIDAIVEEEQVLTDQQALIDGYKDEYANGEFTIENPYIVVNPFGRNELSAYIAFPANDAVSYSYSVTTNDTKYPFNYSSEEIVDGTIVMPVIGLFQDTKNTVELSVETKDGDTQTSVVEIQTEKASSNFNPNTATAEELKSEAGLNLNEEQIAAMGKLYEEVDDATVRTEIKDDSIMDYADGFLVSETMDMFDFDGEIRSSTPEYGYATAPIKVQEGLFLMQDNAHTFFELDFMGRVHDVISIPANEDGEQQFSYHHDAVMSSDGQYYYMLGSWYGDVPEGYNDVFPESVVLVYDRNKGEFTDFFDYSDDFSDGLQSVLPVADERDPIHMNSVDIYEEANQLIYSAKSQSMIWGADIKTGEVEWILKDPAGVTNENPDLLLEATGDDMVYTSGNHTAFVMNTDKYDTTADDLYLSVYNNRNCVNEDQTPAWTAIGDEPGACAISEKSTMLIYHINLADMTVETVEEIAPADRWSFTKSNVFTNHQGIYEVSYADLSDTDGKTFNHSDLYVTDYDGNVLMSVTFDAMTNIYRSRLVNFNETTDSLNANIESL